MPMSTASISLSSPTGSGRTNTDALNEMLKPVQHDKKKRVIPNLFRNLEFGNDKILSVFVLVFNGDRFFQSQPSQARACAIWFVGKNLTSPRRTPAPANTKV